MTSMQRFDAAGCRAVHKKGAGGGPPLFVSTSALLLRGLHRDATRRRPDDDLARSLQRPADDLASERIENATI